MKRQGYSADEHACIDCAALPLISGPLAKDGRPKTPRPAPHGGPKSKRCVTHHRAKVKAAKAASHERRSKSVYGLDDYWGLYQFQGGHCAICQRATGKTRRLSVDHDHATDEVRGLLCRPCNTLLGQARDNIEFFNRCIEYLKMPPAMRWRAQREAPDV